MTKVSLEKEMRLQKWEDLVKKYDMVLVVETGHYRIYANTKNTMGALGKQHDALYLYHDTKDRLNIDTWVNAFTTAQFTAEVRAYCTMFCEMVRRRANLPTI